MAFLDMHVYSDVLKMGVSFYVILPENAKTMIGMESAEDQKTYKTLYLLHGLSGDHTSWMRRSSIERYAAAHGIAVVMPTVARSWYTDTADGAAYLTFITEELPTICRSYFRGMSDKREDTMIAGLSMGGYGAIKAALRCPEKYGLCASLSGAVDIANLRRHVNMEEWRGIFGFSLQSAAELKGTPHDLFSLTQAHKDADKPFPKLYLWCGTEDILVEDNRRYHDLLKSLNVPHAYEESKGNHSWKWWDLHIQDALAFLLK